jgi:hypothetical protein
MVHNFAFLSRSLNPAAGVYLHLLPGRAVCLACNAAASHACAAAYFKGLGGFQPETPGTLPEERVTVGVCVSWASRQVGFVSRRRPQTCGWAGAQLTEALASGYLLTSL